MSGGMAGRDSELEAAADFLDQLADGPAAFVFAGEAGIGKTTLWLAALDRARVRSVTVLTARPAAAEARLPFTALADLLDPAAGEILATLPEPQRHALAVVLLHEDPGDRPVNQRAIGVATVSVLRLLARAGPVVIGIDDLQWLDRSSSRVLAFALRRLGRLPVGLVACERTGAGSGPAPELEQALTGIPVRRIMLGPLEVTALHEVVERQLGRRLPRRILTRIGQVAGGNPLFATEIARVLPERFLPGMAMLPLPGTLRSLLGTRVTALPHAARQALLAAAMLRSPTVDLVAVGMGREASASHAALEQAAVAGIVALSGPGVHFTHPLFGTTVYSLARDGERRSTHRRLAASAGSADERAWHLALAAEGPDAELAEVLDSGAEHARARGAPESAAELTEHALRLTPPDRTADRQYRRVRAAEYQFHAGDLQSARERLRSVIEEVPAGRIRADALCLLGEILYNEQSFPEAAELFEQALEYARDDAGLASALELHLAFVANTASDWASADVHSHRALKLARALGDGPRLAEAMAVSAMISCLVGRGVDEPKLELALALEDKNRQTGVQMRPSTIAGLLMSFQGRLERGCQLLEGVRQQILDRGEEGDVPFICSNLAWAEAWRGRLAAAAVYADEALETASQIGDPARCLAVAYACMPAAYSGDAKATRKLADEAFALSASTGYGIAPIWARWGLAILALSQRDPAAADAALAPLTTHVEREGVAEPFRVMFLAEAIEALTALGHFDRAAGLTAMLRHAAERLERSWAMAQAERCQALLLAARGDLAAAAEAASLALGHAEGLELRLETARTLLVAGEVERRARRKQSARELLGQALVIFEQAGARLWAQRTRHELSRAAARRAGDGLTASEKLVADLAASGLTNRQVAAQLFMSPKTVEANLARVYRKLGIRSRAELGARLASREK